MSDITRLVMVRHGEAQTAVDRIVGGHHGCTGLSDLGREQAGRLRDRLVATGFQPDVVLTSVLPRAVETAEILAGGLGYPTTGIVRRCELCEMHPGEGDGLAWETAVERFGARDPVDEPDRPLAPGGETMNQFAERVAVELARVAEEHYGRTVMVACHGGVIMNAATAFLGLTPRWFYDAMPNTSVTEWVRRDDGPWLLARFNDAAHLETPDS